MSIIVPILFANTVSVAAGGAEISLSPSWALQGSEIQVSGVGFAPHQSGGLTFDGSASAMPKFKTDRFGRFTVSFWVPVSAPDGAHVVEARASSGRGARLATAVVAATLLVGLVDVGGTQPPTAEPSAPPTSGPTSGPSSTPGPATTPPAASATPGASAAPGPGSTPIPGSTTGPTAWQPSLPVRAAFYYPWFPEAWQQGGIDPYTNYHPSLGRYDGASDTVIAQHIAAMRYAGLEAAIASWWGVGTSTDSKIPALLAGARGLKFRWSLYYEAEGSGDPSVTAIRSDLTSIRDRFASDPSYLRIDGRFVIFVYADAGDGCGMADRWSQANTVGAYVVLKVFPGYRTCASQPDEWHQYAPAVARDSQSGHSFAVSPGFWKVGESPRLARDPARFRSDVTAMVTSQAPLQLVTTFNEWGEGTAVESASEWASASGYGTYLDVLHEVLGGAGTPAATATPPPTSPPTPLPTAGPTAPPAPLPTATPPGAGPVTATLTGAGDIASCSGSGDEATAALLGGIPGTIFAAGDLAYETGSPTEFATCFDPSWGQYVSRMWPVPGNHEYGTPGAAGYFAYFGSTAGDPAKGYYAYDLGGWRIYALNSNCADIGGCGAGSGEESWLRADLAAHPQACVAAYWHHPLFSSGEHGNNSSVRALWQALQDAGAELVVNGHDHDYERFTAQTAAGAASGSGIVEYVVGTGGKSHYTFGAPQSNSVVRNDSAYGVIKLTLRTNGWDWQFVPVAGASFTDSGTAVCH
jgi:Calcineurin-like phosphoesterase/Glycosyl hydrolase family 99